VFALSTGFSTGVKHEAAAESAILVWRTVDVQWKPDDEPAGLASIDQLESIEAVSLLLCRAT
jgi:hypothetical protein